MQNLMRGFYAKMYSLFHNERGAQSLEWLGLAALLILVLGIISQVLGNEGKSQVKNILTNIFDSISKMVGGG
ncbi:hypothetical protein GLW08_20640 [Pontibacillus yanchengensis]|uniref:Uncharacterized protein n=2 Tax=Pontibacillus yanchengensis TaxID=462910 RepID=A0A6I5A3S0_9BACI|nr:hypothetical protein [Pontibacillus yanchengensis]MYL33829.1 hypothetical protein [Pontibacillus yanchengensis]MYL55713.1 hypothetical protein [Pontibacillus yanchengensis]